MASFNKVILMGNLTRDPELRYSSKGTAIAKIGLAVNRTWRTETGENREEVTFVDCDAFGRTAETLSQYLKKGNPVLVEGRLRLHTWEDKQTNQKVNKLRVDIETFRFVGAASGGSGGGGGGGPRESGSADAPRPRSAATPAAAEPAGFESEPMPQDDDVPF